MRARQPLLHPFHLQQLDGFNCHRRSLHPIRRCLGLSHSYRRPLSPRPQASSDQYAWVVGETANVVTVGQLSTDLVPQIGA